MTHMFPRAVPVAIVCAAICLLSASVFSAPKKVCCVGNSITEECGYPEKLQELLGSSYVVHNEGFSGATMQKNGDEPYWRTAKFRDVFSVKPDIIVLKLGTNDAKSNNWKGSAKFSTDYRAMIDTFQTISTNPKIFLVLCTPAFANNSEEIDGDTIHLRIVPAILSIANTEGLSTIDCHTPFLTRQSLFPDKVHPNTAGADSIAGIVFGALATTQTETEPAMALTAREASGPARAVFAAIGNRQSSAVLVHGIRGSLIAPSGRVLTPRAVGE